MYKIKKNTIKSTVIFSLAENKQKNEKFKSIYHIHINEATQILKMKI